MFAFYVVARRRVNAALSVCVFQQSSSRRDLRRAPRCRCEHNHAHARARRTRVHLPRKSKMSHVPEDVNGDLYWSAAELLKAFESKKSTLVKTYGTRVIDTRDVNFKWMWVLIQGHSRGAEKVGKATTFRLTRRGDIYLVGTTGEPLKDARGKWVHVGKDGLVCNRFRTTDVTSYRQKVFKVMRDLVRDQASEFREKASATGMGCDMHVGHSEDTPFGALIVEFMFAKGWPLPCLVEDLVIERVSPESGDYKLASDTFAKLWQEYHREHAKLFMQPARDNLSDNYNNKRTLWQLEGKLADTDTAPPQKKAKAKT